jgi:hypothetical protein
MEKLLLSLWTKLAFHIAFTKGEVKIKLGVVRKGKKIKCPAILKIQDGWLISGRNNHNHENEELLHKAVRVNLEDEIVQKYLKN